MGKRGSGKCAAFAQRSRALEPPLCTSDRDAPDLSDAAFLLRLHFWRQSRTFAQAMQMTPGILLGLAILAYALGRVPERNNPARRQRLASWQKFVGVVAVIVAVLIAISPEFLAFGLLGDTAFFDLLVLLISLQLHAVGVQARCWIVGALSKARWWVLTPRLSYLLVISALAAVGNLISGIGRVVHRITS